MKNEQPASAVKSLKNLTLFLDRKGYMGFLTEYSPPDRAFVTLGGTEDAINAASASFVLNGYDADALSLWGFVAGEKVPLTICADLESFDSTVTKVMHQMRCRLMSIKVGARPPGVQGPLTIDVSVEYFKETRGDTFFLS